MLQNINDPPEPWADIIRTHFRLKAKALTAQLDQWLAEDDGCTLDPQNGGRPTGTAGASGGGVKNGFKADVDGIKELLGKLTANAASVTSSI